MDSAGYCAGAVVSVSFLVTGCLGTSNVFSLQLSDTSGGFDKFTNIGSAKSQGSGTISGTIPAGTAEGTGYRVRVIASSPYLAGDASQKSFAVYPSPKVADKDYDSDVSILVNPSPALTGTQVTMKAVSKSGTLYDKYEWTFENDAVPPSATGAVVQTTFATPGPQSPAVKVTTKHGCSATYKVTSKTSPCIQGFVVFSCNPKIPSNATVHKGTCASEKGSTCSSSSVTWLCAGSAFASGGGCLTHYVEPGASLTSGGGGSNVAFVKAGGSAPSGASTVIFEPGASVPTGVLLLECPKLTFDYSTAPKPGCF